VRRAGVLEKLNGTERRVAELVGRGKTNQEVADHLHVSAKTVEWNLTKVYRKLGVRSRTELALKVRGFPRAGGVSVVDRTEDRKGDSE
jgi:DNA-binding CsgD family transcriptional regulator